MKPVEAQIQGTFPVRLEGGAACPKFGCRADPRHSLTRESPFLMQERLRRAGLRPISAVVDITNYVMLDFGRSQLAYNLGQLNGGIMVRVAQVGRKAENPRRSRTSSSPRIYP